MAVEVRPYNRAGQRLALSTLPAGLPWSTCKRVVVRNAVESSIEVDTPASLIDALALGPEVYLRIAVDGVEQPDWYVLDDDGDDPASDQGPVRPVSTGGRGVISILEWGTVYPQDHVAGGSLLGLDPIYEFANATVGQIMVDLVTKAKARGCFPHLTLGFTATTDSSGAAWPVDQRYSLTFDAGQSLLSILTTMMTDGWCDAEMVGFTLNLYAPDTVLAADHPDVVLRLGREVKSAPRKRTRRSVISVLLGGGDEGAMVEVADSDASVKFGRREGYEGRGGITDIGVLASVTTTSLQRQTDVSEALTLDLEPSAAPVIPRPGHYLRYDQRRLNDVTLEPLRVQSIAWEYGDSPTLSVELNDLWLDRDVRMQRRIDALTNGSGSNERVPTASPPIADDGVAPVAPGGVTVTPFVYYPTRYTTISGLSPQSAANVTWPPVSQNSDGTPFNDFGRYVVSMLLVDRGGSTWSAERGSQTNSIQWSGFALGEAVQFRVAAEDQDGNRSAWQYSSVTALVATAGPVAQAPDPTVASRLGQVFVTWNGLTKAGAVPDRWIVGAEVHSSTTAGFTADNSTVRAFLGSAGDAVIPGLALGTPQYVRLVLVDFLGNRGVASNAISVTPQLLVTADMLDGAVGSAKLADLAVTTAKIADLSVNDAKIVSVQAGKITTGTLYADVILSGSIQTASAGARTALNANGFTAYNSSGSITVRIDTAGNGTFAGTITAAQVTGYLRTVASGGAQIVMQPNGVTAPDGTVVPALLMSTAESGETSPGKLYTYSATYDATRRWMHTVMQSPVVSTFGPGYSYIRCSIVGKAGGYASAQYVPAEVTLGFGDGASVVAVPNLTSTLDTSTSAPGLSFRTTSGTGAGLRALNNNLDVVNVSGSAYATIRAAAFTQQSGSASKVGIRPADDVDALAVIRANPAMLWRYKPEVSTDGRERIGPLADGLPGLVVQRDPDGRLWMDHGGVNGFLWRAVEQLALRQRRLAA